MKRYLAVLCYGLSVFLFGICNVANGATPAGSKTAAQVHLDAAKAAAYRPGNDLTRLYDTVCAPALSEKGPHVPDPSEGGQTAVKLANRKIPPRASWYSEPTKVFDNLYWLGSQENSTWAVMTSEGIILIDTGMDYTSKELIADGLKKLGADPTQIKYVILSHVHDDRYYGAKYLQDTYHPHIVMTEADWDVMPKSNEAQELSPKKDMVATEGMKLTLGDTTLTLYITPGHTPGTISTLVPLKDGNQRHVGVVWGGINPSYARYGVQYYPSLQETFKTWSASVTRFQAIAAKAGADTYLTIHPFYDKALDKMNALRFREPGAPHPFVSKDNLNRFLTIIKECTDAQLARVAD